MSQENVEAVRRYYENFNRGDHDAANAFLAPEFVADYSRRSIEPGIARGRAEAIAVAEKIREAWADLVVEPEELIEAGDHVLAVVANRARGARSGAPAISRTAQLWTLRGGEAIRFEYFGTKEDALEALGLRE